ncbi:MAG: uroporphyrinogen-III C-methyltransferase [Bacteroidota bacterium]
MCKTILPKITLVGAGPGDPDLITMKGVRALQQADVILYDALVDRRLLEYASENCLTIYVGKRANKHSRPQQSTNQLMVHYARTHGHVVRLKGGDPFVFGRGHEEKVFAEEHGISVEVVPGISSSISVPALQGVPVTRRGVNESFWVMTATTSRSQLSSNVALAAQSTATVVILMGIRKLPQIVRQFKIAGKPDTPLMIVQSGSTTKEKCVLATVDTILERIQEESIGTPGIIVIGEVVTLHPDYLQKVTNVIAAQRTNTLASAAPFVESIMD